MKPKWQIWIIDKKKVDKDFKNYLKKNNLRKINPSFNLSKVHLDKAFHNLDFANFSLNSQDIIHKRINQENYYDWVIIISYYAMYHSALSLLYYLGYKSSSHLATICVLCKKCLGKYLNKGDIKKISVILELSEEEIKEIGEAKERREIASYSGSISFEKSLAQITLEDAQKFINKIAEIIEELIKNEGELR